MCRSMADIQSMAAAEIRRGKKIEEDRRRRQKLQGKNIMVPLLHRAAINILLMRSVSKFSVGDSPESTSLHRRCRRDGTVDFRRVGGEKQA